MHLLLLGEEFKQFMGSLECEKRDWNMRGVAALLWDIELSWCSFVEAKLLFSSIYFLALLILVI